MEAEIIAIVILAGGIVAAGGTAIAVAFRNGTLRVDKTRLGNSLVKSELNRDETRAEFERYQKRSDEQLEGLRDDLNDYADLFATCTDPAIILTHLDGMLSKAAARPDSDPRPD